MAEHYFALPAATHEGDPPVIALPSAPGTEGDGVDRFECLPVMPAGAWRSLGSYDFAAEAAHRFIEGCLIDDATVARWRARMSSKDSIVPHDTVADVMHWLISEYAHRPFGSPSASPGGPTSTAPGSEGEHSTPASTSTPSGSPQPSTSSTSS